MDTKLCEYMIAIAEQGSISQAAEKLYLTQSALNQQLLKLEKELGAPLFIRTRNHWTVTPVGEVYIENARKMLAIKATAYAQIEDLAKHWRGTITIGLTAERGMQMFSSVYPDMHARYPHTIFQPVEATVEEQNKLLDAGQMDIAFQTIREKKYKSLTYQTILNEPFVLCIPRTHPLAYADMLPPDQFPTISLSLFRNEVFTLVRKSSTMRQMVDRLFEQAGFYPRLLFDSVGMRSMQKLTANGQCCCIIPRFYAIPSSRVAYFFLGNDACWELAAVYRTDHYLTRASRDFIDMASAYWHSHLYVE
ncbi:MAG: LysR family transcriptional regulator [Clostridia bacterium]|nr:LysR family transcriptional regulator [Clostridia bacterium]